MEKFTAFLPRLFYNRLYWQMVLAAFLIGMAIFFIRHEQLEFLAIKQQFRHLHLFYAYLGVLLTAGYIVLQGAAYQQSFRAFGVRVSLRQNTRLFLKRNLLSILLPAGGFASLAFFSRRIEATGTSKTQIYLASSLYAICGILSVVVVAVPIMGFALLQGQLRQSETLAVGYVILLAGGLLAFGRSFWLRGRAYRLIQSHLPQFAVLADDITAHSVSRRHFWAVMGISVCIDLVGIVHLYLAMLALGQPPSLAAASSAYVGMVVLLLASPFLRGLGAIEVSMTYILGQYGFSVVAAASITLLFRVFEFWLPLVAGIGSFFTSKENVLLRLFPALLIFTVGITNVISAITPAIPNRLRFVEEVLPLGLVSASNGLVLVSGLLLVLLAVFLLEGSRRAWWATLLLASLSVLGHLFKAADFEEALFAAMAVAVLLYTRDYYRLKPHPVFTRLSYQVFLYGLAALLLYGVLGFYYVDKHHFGIDFKLGQAIATVFRLFFLLDASGITPLTSFGQKFIYSFYGAGAAYLLFVLYGFLRTYFSKPYNTEEEKALVAELARQYGRSALDYFKTYPDKLFFITADRQSFVSFKVSKHLAVVLEDPVSPDLSSMRAAVIAFDKYCQVNGLIPVYFRVPEASLPLYGALGKKSFPVGEEAIVDLSTFTLAGGRMKATRSALNRLREEGFVCRHYEPPVKLGLLQKLELVSDQWLAERGGKEIAFTQGIFNPAILKHQPIFTVEDAEERVYAFLNLVPVSIPGMATYDLIRKVADAPNGVLDMLLCHTFQSLQAQGFQQVNMGLVPMSGMEGVNLTERTIRYAYEHFRSFDRFKGLRKFKEKYNPRWEKRFLVYNHNYHLLQVPAALNRVSHPS